MRSFSARLKIALDRKNMSGSELSELTGIRASSISDWLNGRYEAKQDKVYILSKVLEVSPAWLMGWEDEKDNDIHTIAAHAIQDLSEEEIEEVLNFARYIKSKHKDHRD